MQTFKESLNSELPYRVTKRTASGLVAVVDDGVNGAVWRIDFDRMADSEKQMYLYVGIIHSKTFFDRPAERKPTATALKLYATVGKLLRNYIKGYPIHYIMFSPTDPKMIPVYDYLAKKIANALDGKVDVNTFFGKPIYKVFVGEHYTRKLNVKKGAEQAPF